MAKILLLNGPNLNLLGQREPAQYGKDDLKTLEQDLVRKAHGAQHLLTTHQSNDEGALIDAIHEAQAQQVDYLIFNPAAYTHTSIALRDALLAVAIPFIEVHISNVYQREAFRQHSYFSDIAQGVIIGFGIQGYHLALQAILERENDGHS